MSVYITNYEVECNAGDLTSLMQALYNKESKITIDTNYINGNEPVGLGKMKDGNFFEILLSKVSNVLKASSLNDFKDTLLIVGSSVGGMRESETIYFRDGNYKNIDPSKHAISVISETLDQEFSFADTRAISTACTSSANALLLAKRLIEVDAYKNILVVGADALCHTTVCGFHALGVLSDTPCRPFDKSRNGMNVAEAIAVLLLSSEKSDESIEFLGAGASSDAHHITHPDPEGKGAMAAMSAALKDAEIEPSEIDYINAHGTGTVANDNVEALAISQMFNNCYVSSSKAITGHTLGAAGALEATIACETIRQGIIPPQTGLIEQENNSLNIPTDPIETKPCYVLSNSFAFGGNNASLLLGRVK